MIISFYDAIKSEIEDLYLVADIEVENKVLEYEKDYNENYKKFEDNSSCSVIPFKIGTKHKDAVSAFIKYKHTDFTRFDVMRKLDSILEICSEYEKARTPSSKSKHLTRIIKKYNKDFPFLKTRIMWIMYPKTSEPLVELFKTRYMNK